MKKWIITCLLSIGISSIFAYSYEDMYNSMMINNIDLQKQDEVIKQAVLDVKNAKGSYSPTIDMTLSATYMSNPPIDEISLSVDELLSAAGLPYGGTGAYIPIYDGMENTLYQASVNLTQPIFTWGKITNSVKLYDTVLDMRNLEKEDKEALLSTQLEGYIGAFFYLGQVEEKLDEALSVASNLVDISKSGYQNGVMLLTDYREAELSLTELKLKKTEVEHSRAQVLEQLRVLTGIGDLTEDDIDLAVDEMVAYQICTFDRDSLRRAAVSEERNNMKLLSMMNEVNDIKTDIMKGGLYWKPDLALQLGLNFTSQRFPFIEKGWYTSQYSGVTVSLGMKTTLWDGGVKWNEVKRSESQARSGILDKADAKSQVSLTLEDQFRVIDYSIAEMEYMLANSQLLETQYGEIVVQKDVGYAGEADILQKKLELLENDMKIIEIKTEILQSVCTVKYITGLTDSIIFDKDMYETIA